MVSASVCRVATSSTSAAHRHGSSNSRSARRAGLAYSRWNHPEVVAGLFMVRPQHLRREPGAQRPHSKTLLPEHHSLLTQQHLQQQQLRQRLVVVPTRMHMPTSTIPTTPIPLRPRRQRQRERRSLLVPPAGPLLRLYPAHRILGFRASTSRRCPALQRASCQAHPTSPPTLLHRSKPTTHSERSQAHLDSLRSCVPP